MFSLLPGLLPCGVDIPFRRYFFTPESPIYTRSPSLLGRSLGAIFASASPGTSSAERILKCRVASWLSLPPLLEIT